MHPDDIVQAPFLIDFIKGLKRRKHHIFVFTQDRKGRKDEILEGVKVKWFPWMKVNKPLVNLNLFNPLDLLRIGTLFFSGRKEIISFVREQHIQTCLALWVLPSGYLANYVYRKTGIPYSVWALGSDIYRYGRNPLLHPLMERIIKEARGVFADGFDLAKRIEESFGRKCQFLSTSRKIPNLSYRDEKSKKGHVPYRFLFVGRLEKVKGIDILLRAVELLKEENQDFHLTVVGRGRMEEWAKAFVIQKGMEDKVSLIGFIPDLELSSLYHCSNCVVIPSRSESIPLVFSEALSLNKEMIVTDVGDMGRLGREYEIAEVVPPGNPFALKEALKKKIFSSEDSQMEVRRRDLLKFFDMERSIEKFLEDYKELNS